MNVSVGAPGVPSSPGAGKQRQKFASLQLSSEEERVIWRRRGK